MEFDLTYPLGDLGAFARLAWCGGGGGGVGLKGGAGGRVGAEGSGSLGAPWGSGGGIETGDTGAVLPLESNVAVFLKTGGGGAGGAGGGTTVGERERFVELWPTLL